jgi:hypothetical protein
MPEWRIIAGHDLAFDGDKAAMDGLHDLRKVIIDLCNGLELHATGFPVHLIQAVVPGKVEIYLILERHLKYNLHSLARCEVDVK